MCEHSNESLQQYFYMVLFIFLKVFYKRNIGFFVNFDFRHPLGVKELKMYSFVIPSSHSLFLFAFVFFLRTEKGLYFRFFIA